MKNILPERENMMRNALVPGASAERKPIIPNIIKFENAAKGTTSTMVSGRDAANILDMANYNSGSMSRMASHTNTNQGLFNLSNMAPEKSVPGLIGKETMTFRGQLESLENVLIDVVSEIKYHRRQLDIIKAEQETVGAVLQMGIV